MPLETFVSAKWVKPLFKQLLKIRGSREQALTALADRFTDPTLLAKYYIEPFCQNFNPADFDESEGRTATKEPAFKMVNDFLRGEFLRRDGRSQLFVLSDAGMGKTSLLLMVKLMHLTRFWPAGFECVLLKLGRESLATIEQLPDRSQTVLLLDALDEDPMAWGRIEKRLAELLTATTQFRQVVISCRTQFFPSKDLKPLTNPGQVVIAGFKCQMVFLSLFDDEQVAGYLEKRFPTFWYQFSFQQRKVLRKRARAEQILDSMGSLRLRPMLLAHIEDLLKEEEAEQAKQVEWNVYTVFRELVDVWLRREERKFREFYGSSKEQLPTCEDLLQACIQVAEAMQRAGTRSLPAADLQSLIAGNFRLGWLADEAFDVGGRSLLNRNSENAFRFSHYTIQEFLLAEGLLRDGLRSREALRPTDQLLKFLRFSGKQNVFKGLNHEFLPIPQMVKISKGSFEMGGEAEHEKPIHIVTIDYDFAMGKYPVTFEEYDFYCEQTGQTKPDDEGWGRGKRPVIKVSWNDAVAYCEWLSEQTGEQYRLPSEAEWEYACRAGTTTEYWWGDKMDDSRCWYEGNSGDKTHQVNEAEGQHTNPWGLVDMSGNVWEWTGSEYASPYNGNELKFASKNNASRPVLRGGSWFDGPYGVRSALRNYFTASNRSDGIGFRLARM